MILLSHIEPADNLDRWYLVSIQATLFFPCAVVIAWGRRDNNFQQWRAIPVDTLDHAQELANKIVKKKLQRGYQVCPLPPQSA
ncbi:MAG TPA: WGR domain-containing protein [Anaerolineales bacterium]|nr:WGR domain-containing protein [Anaerolineales bacterium]